MMKAMMMRMKKPMMKCRQLCVCIPNTPGTLGKMTAVLHRKKMNITGVMIEDLGDVSYVRFNCNKPAMVKRIMHRAGYECFANSGFCVEMPNKPGMLCKMAKTLGSKGINIRHIYGTTYVGKSCCMMVMVDQPSKAMPILMKFCRQMRGRIN